MSALRAFEAAARTGSFKDAAGELNVTPTAISHQVKSLEDHTGLVLFDRAARRKIELTEFGARLYPVLQAGFDAIESTLKDLDEARGRTRITIGAANVFISRWLVPRLGDFHTDLPLIDLHLESSDNAANGTPTPTDIIISREFPEHTGYREETIFTDAFTPVCTPSVAQALADKPQIHIKWKTVHPRNPTWEMWQAAAGANLLPSLGKLVVSDEAHAAQAALTGQGVALLSVKLVECELRSGQLVQVSPITLPGHCYHFAIGPEGVADPQIAAVADWLRSRLRTVVA